MCVTKHSMKPPSVLVECDFFRGEKEVVAGAAKEECV